MGQNEVIRLARRFRELSRESWGSTFLKGADKLAVFAYAPIARRRCADLTFTCLGTEHRYFVHPYNATWRNERCVEIALAAHFLAERRPARVLELGNVLSYYGRDGHDVVDKYERSPGVRNMDLLDLDPGTERAHDAFVSISTLEHIGWDESPRDPAKVVRAWRKIEALNQGNKDAVFITFPLGYNDALDAAVRDGVIRFQKTACLVRSGPGTEWREAPLAQGLGKRYASLYPAANALLVGVGIAN